MNIRAVPRDSRYKDTQLFESAAGVEWGVFIPPPEIVSEPSEEYVTHVVKSHEVGFLDLIAVRYYGDGAERFWWVIALTNNIIDPETDMEVGQQLAVPPRSFLSELVARS